MVIGMSLEDFGNPEGLPDGNEVHKAIVDGNPDHLSKLASSNISLEIKNPYGLTPLHVACLRKSKECVEILVRYGMIYNKG